MTGIIIVGNALNIYVVTNQIIVQIAAMKMRK